MVSYQREKCYFTNLVTSCQHTWQCDMWMSHCQVRRQLVTAFHKNGKVCNAGFVTL